MREIDNKRKKIVICFIEYPEIQDFQDFSHTLLDPFFLDKKFPIEETFSVLKTTLQWSRKKK